MFKQIPIAIIALLLCFSIEAAAAPYTIENVSFDCAVSSAPKLNPTDPLYTIIREPKVKFWGLICVSYQLTGAAQWLQDCSAELQILIQQPKKSNKLPIVLTGQYFFAPLKVTPRQNDKTKQVVHRVLFVLPPDAIVQYFGKELITPASLKQLSMRFLFRNNRRAVIGTDMSNRKDQKKWTFIDGQGKRSVRKTEQLIPKDRSPWGPIAVDSFDLPKSMFEGN